MLPGFKQMPSTQITHMAQQVSIRQLKEEDYTAVRNIYQLGINTGHATFETTAPAWKEWDAKFLKAFRLVAVAEDKVVGWAALSAVSSRRAYAGVGEVSLYI